MTFDIDLIRNVLQIVGAIFFVVGVFGTFGLFVYVTPDAYSLKTAIGSKQIVYAVMLAALLISGTLMLMTVLPFSLDPSSLLR